MQMLLFYCYHKSKLISALKTAEFSVNYFLKTVFCVRKGKFNDKFSVFFNTIFVYKSKYLKNRKSPTYKPDVFCNLKSIYFLEDAIL